MLHLLRKETRWIRPELLTLLVGFFLLSQNISAQKEQNLYDHDTKPYYFGITLGVNTARFQTTLHPKFLLTDSVQVAEPANAGGFTLGLSATARLSDRFQLRFNPQLMFIERKLFYQLKYPELGETKVTKTVESVLVSFPVQVKLQSDRIGNFRVYMMTGVKGDIDLASNARSKKTEDLLKIKASDYGVELGLGFNFFFQSFIFSPEIKISNGLGNVHSRDENLKYSNVFDKIKTRMIVFGIHIEG